MRVLIVEDDETIAEAMALRFKEEGFVVDITGSGEDAISMARHDVYDIATVDLGLPDVDGLDVVKALSRGKRPTPSMVVSGDDDVDMRVRCLIGGAADVLGKPFHGDELVARIRAIVRRHRGRCSDVVRFGELAVDLCEQRATYAGEPVSLSRTEFRVLAALAATSHAISRDDLMLAVYGLEQPEPKILDVVVLHLRRKLAAASGGRTFITTRWGFGFQLTTPTDPCGLAAAE